METVREIHPESQIKDPNHYLELGNNAGKLGNIEESVSWYMKGLTLAKELKDRQSINKLSVLIALSH